MNLKLLSFIKLLSLALIITFLASCSSDSSIGSITLGSSPSMTTKPTNNQLKVSPDLNEIIVDFGKEIDPNSLNSSTFIVNNGMTGSISTANNNTRAIYTLNEVLTRETTYIVILNGITDPQGNSILPNSKEEYSWSFSTCNNIPESTYEISWNSISDADLVSYKVYYDNSVSLNKLSAKSVNITYGTNWVLNPTNLGYLPCDNIKIAITATGNTKGESGLSKISTIIID